MKHGPVTVIAACVALSAFTVAIVAGLSAGNPAVAVLLRAVLVMLIGYPAGLVIGKIIVQVVRAHEMTHEDGNGVSENDEGENGDGSESAAAARPEPAPDEQEAVAI